MTSPSGPPVYGTVAAGFEHVREAFHAFVASEPTDPGAQLAVHLDGEQVVDLWSGPDFPGDAMTGLYSITKGATHLVVALLVQDGVLDLERTVASYWPGFGAHGKDRLTLRELLSHRAGLIGADGGFTPAELADDRLIAERLAPHRPHWEPGTGYGYHAFVIGALTGEVVRRATGHSLQEHFEQRLRAPYGLDLHLGLPAALEERYRPVLPMELTPAQAAELAARVAAPDSLLGIASNRNAAERFDLVEFVNTRHTRALGQASAGGVGNARGVAAMYAAALTLLQPDTLAEFTKLHTPGTDLVTAQENHFLLGFEAPGYRYPFLAPTTFGHSGATGSQAFADPATGLTYAYVRRRFLFDGGGGSPENEALAGAVWRGHL